MQLRFFAIPALDPVAPEAELNRLLAAGRVADLERQFVAAGAARKVDYREVLSKPDFAVFARLRALRKSVADSEGVPPYAVFTNEQLAAMATGRVSTAEELGRIEGGGAARVKRYSASFLPMLRDTLPRKTEG